MQFRRIFITLIAADIVLGTIAYLVVFYNTPGTYDIANSPIPSTSVASGTIVLPPASSTVPTSTAGGSSGDSSSDDGGSSSGATTANIVFATDYAVPYPLTWAESGANISITGASLQANQLTFKLEVAMGNVMRCIPLNVRMLLDEQGNFASPITPQFTFPETNACQGAPGATYTGQQVIFDLNGSAFPAYFTTGGSSNIFFSVATTTAGRLNVSVPQRSG